ncbi:DNA-binding domain-containing protein [Aeromonas veronii]|uniref:DNA-binding domain-containing protein n=1 Tax=Aeromonas veronii TaxID=654 RepID=UPI002B470705|nr:DNA-binding domain-containing protein [Aeromonas veronii]
MSELAQRQQQFADSLLGEDGAILQYIHSRLFAAESVLQVYRNHFILSLSEVLASSYPAVKAMVGDDFFAAAARGFVLAEPLREGSVMHYGAGFSDRLAQLPTTTGLPWLGELARFEWALERTSLLQLESRNWPAERIAALPASAWESLVLIPASDLRLFDSTYPVLALWQMAIHNGEVVSELTTPAWLVLKKQPDCRVMPLALTEREWRLLEGCLQGRPLSALLEQDPQAGNYLPHFITLGLLVDVTSTEEQA